MEAVSKESEKVLMERASEIRESSSLKLIEKYYFSVTRGSCPLER